jgi:hypothetical protein
MDEKGRNLLAFAVKFEASFALPEGLWSRLGR